MRVRVRDCVTARPAPSGGPALFSSLRPSPPFSVLVLDLKHLVQLSSPTRHGVRRPCRSLVVQDEQLSPVQGVNALGSAGQTVRLTHPTPGLSQGKQPYSLGEPTAGRVPTENTTNLSLSPTSELVLQKAVTSERSRGAFLGADCRWGITPQALGWFWRQSCRGEPGGLAPGLGHPECHSRPALPCPVLPPPPGSKGEGGAWASRRE